MILRAYLLKQIYKSEFFKRTFVGINDRIMVKSDISRQSSTPLLTDTDIKFGCAWRRPTQKLTWLMTAKLLYIKLLSTFQKPFWSSLLQRHPGIEQRARARSCDHARGKFGRQDGELEKLTNARTIKISMNQASARRESQQNLPIFATQYPGPGPVMYACASRSSAIAQTAFPAALWVAVFDEEG
jgi:hypothetical protein